MTRALHHLLNGDLVGALYYNWLVFPLVIGALALGAIFSIELVSRRIILTVTSRVRPTPRALAGSFTVLALLWVLQVYLAVSQHKQELLNSNGVFYAFFVK